MSRVTARRELPPTPCPVCPGGRGLEDRTQACCFGNRRTPRSPIRVPFVLDESAAATAYDPGLPPPTAIRGWLTRGSGFDRLRTSCICFLGEVASATRREDLVASLFVIQGADQGKRFEFKSSPVALGRDNSNAIRLHDTEVSRRHAELRQEEETYRVIDLGSANGTFVNGQLI